MLLYPNINPVAFHLGPLKVHWYGLMYLFAFLMAWGLAHWRVKRYGLDWSSEQISDLIFYTALGAVLGGRLGYTLFYNFTEFYHAPTVIFRIWEGGMSFHGGLLGVVAGIFYFCRRYKRSFYAVGDFVVPLVPLGLAAGRLGNFINGELWGRVTEVPWGMIFPRVDNLPHHPSQLYELGLEGLALFCLVWIYAAKRRPEGSVIAVFLIGYALARIFNECFREPDLQLGFLAFDWLTMGQLLSIPMLLIGIIMLWNRRHEDLPTAR